MSKTILIARPALERIAKQAAPLCSVVLGPMVG